MCPFYHEPPPVPYTCPAGRAFRAPDWAGQLPYAGSGGEPGSPGPEEAMADTRFEIFDPLLPGNVADSMIRLCERFGSYGMYAEEPIRDGIGQGLTQRHDAALNFVKTGGRFGRKEELATLAARTNYFRESYAYDKPLIEGIEPFLRHEGFLEGARKIFDRPIVVPNIVFANLLVPGQELAVHTDVPEFRGMNRTRDPQWLLVVMHHSGLFERWRMPIATGVSWFRDGRGGEFVFYPDGPTGAPRALPVRHNTAILLDTDSTFHGVDRVADPAGGGDSRVEQALEGRAQRASEARSEGDARAEVRGAGGERSSVGRLKPGMRLRFEGDGRWSVGLGDDTVARYRWEDLRFSISWKAYCYADEAERRCVEEHGDDLVQAQVVERLALELRRRGRLEGPLPGPRELGLLLIDEFIHFPPPAPA